MSSIIRAVGYTGRRSVITWPNSQAWGADVTAYLWGGGGGGGGPVGSNTGGNGSGGSFAAVNFSVVPGDVLEISVGGQGGGGSVGAGAWGGAPGPSLMLSGQPFTTPQTGLARNTNKRYCTFLNNTGVWGEQAQFDYSQVVNFPVSAFYTVVASVDNYGFVYIDGEKVLSAPGFSIEYTTTVYVTAGNHTVRLVGTNTGGPRSFGCTITSTGSGYSGGYGGRSGYKDSRGAGGGGGGATILRVNDNLKAIAAGGGGGGGAGLLPQGGWPGNSSQITSLGFPGNGADGADNPSRGGGGGAGGGGYRGGGGGLSGISVLTNDFYGYAGQYGESYVDAGVTETPNGRVPGGTGNRYYQGSIGAGGPSGLPGSPGYAVLEFNINGLLIRDSNTWKRAKSVYINRNNSWQEVKSQWVKSAGQWTPLEGSPDAPNFTPLDSGYGYANRVGTAPTVSTVICIAVIDETDRSADYFQSRWNLFTTTYPLREFRLLQPGGPSRGNLRVPNNFYTFIGARGPITVNRDNGASKNRSDWFALCGMQNYDQNAKVLLSIDNSGSMNNDTVAASYQLFLEKCLERGIVITQLTMSPREDWITPFFVDA